MSVPFPPLGNVKTTEDNRGFFAAYLNTARHNVYIILSDLSARLELPPLEDERQMIKVALFTELQKNTPLLVGRIAPALEEHFKFLPMLLAKLVNREEGEVPSSAHYYAAFKELLLLLDEYRNFYTHAIHREYVHSDIVIYWLRHLFDAAVKVKSKALAEQGIEVKHLNRRTEKVILSAKGEKEEKTTHVEPHNYYYAFGDTENHITEKGLAYFICLFLEKKDAYTFLKKLHGFKRGETPAEKATLEVFTAYGVRLPYPRLQSGEICLDMLNELKRCPKILHAHLSPQDKQYFRVKEEIRSDEQNAESTNILLPPRTNRFPYFAMRYLEERNAFTGLRFYIDLGNFYYRAYPKKLDGETRIRRLVHRLKGFGYLNDFVLESHPDEWKPLVRNTHELLEDYPGKYIAATAPQYHISNNAIGIGLTQGNPVWPELGNIYSLSEEQIKTTNPKELRKPKNTEPDMWLSIYELPALALHDYLTRQQDPYATEQILMQHVEKIRGFFHEIERGAVPPALSTQSLDALLAARGLTKTHLPDILRRFLTSAPPAAEPKKDKVKAMVAETQRLRKRFKVLLEQNKEKPGKKFFRIIKPGKLAVFLSRDMVRLQPATGSKDKATGALFVLLQEKLAFYDSNQHLLHALFKQCNLIESKNAHPFLWKVQIDTNRGIIGFYEQYLAEREAFLKNIIATNSFDVYFLRTKSRRKKQETSYYKKLAALLAKPINFPRGLFKDALIEWFKVHGSEAMKKEIETARRVNAVYLIAKYLEKDLDDAPQKFYTFPHGYRAIDQFFDTRTEKQKKKKSLQKFYFKSGAVCEKVDSMRERIMKRKEGSESDTATKLAIGACNKIDKEEKLIRHAKTADMALFLLANDLLKVQFPEIQVDARQNAKLRDIEPNGEKDILSTVVRFKLPMTYSFEREDPAFEDFPDAPPQSKIIYQDERIRNYGRFRAFMRDRRLNNLLFYIPQSEMSLVALEKELHYYDTARIQILEQAYAFEKCMQEKFGKDLTLRPEQSHIKHRVILGKFSKAYTLNADPNSIMNILRNAFCHNAYPYHSVFKAFKTHTGNDYSIDGSHVNEIIKHKEHSVALQFLRFATDTYQSFIGRLNQ